MNDDDMGVSPTHCCSTRRRRRFHSILFRVDWRISFFIISYFMKNEWLKP